MTQRDRMVLAVVVAIAALGAFWFLVLGPKREEASKLSDKVSTEQKRLQDAQQTVAAGQAAKQAYPRNYATVARLGEAVPVEDQMPSLVVQVNAAARSTGVDFRALKLSGGTGGPQAPPPAPAPSPSSSDSSSSGDKKGSNGDKGSDSSGSTTTVDATQAAAAAAPPGTVVGAAGFPTMPFSFTFQGSFFKLSDFFARLQRFIVATNRRVAVSGRLLTIDGIGLGPGNNGFPQIKAGVAATAYLLPPDEGLTNGATPGGPSAGQAASGSAPAAGAPATAAPLR